MRYSLPESVHRLIAGIGPHFPSLTDFDWDECQECVSFPLQGLVPFDGDGHWHFCFYYRRSAKNPSVTYVDIECDSESPIAETFAAYLAKLEPKVNDEYVLEVVADIEQAVAKLSTAPGAFLSTRFLGQRIYAIPRANRRRKICPRLIPISANTAAWLCARVG